MTLGCPHCGSLLTGKHMASCRYAHKGTTIADEFIRQWSTPARSCMARTLIRKLDPQAVKTNYPGGFQYTFSDGSVIYNTGRGWKILHTLR